MKQVAEGEHERASREHVGALGEHERAQREHGGASREHEGSGREPMNEMGLSRGAKRRNLSRRCLRARL